MTARLYRVRITEIFESRAEASDLWVAATSAKQAKQRALAHCYTAAPPEWIHVHAECFRGGVAFKRHRSLEQAA